MRPYPFYIVILVRLYEVYGKLLSSPRSSPFAFPSHCLKVLYGSFQKGIARKHSLERNASTLDDQLSFHGCFSQDPCTGWGARGSKSRHLLKDDFLLSSYANSLWRKLVSQQSRLWHWLLYQKKKVSMTYISRASDFTLYLEDFDERQILG